MNVGFAALVPLTLSGTYPTLGDPVDFVGLAPLAKQPKYVQIMSKAGFVYQYDLANKKLITYCNTAGGANAALGEHTNATYVAGILAEQPIYALVIF